jgi:hypothetical protein
MASSGFPALARLHLPLIVGLGAAPLAFAFAASCTIFDNIKDVPASLSDGGPDTSIGVTPGPDTDSDGGSDAGPTQVAYLSVEDAARLCSLAFRCKELPATITGATSVPIDPQNYSDCMTWLTGPIPPTRIGLQIQASVLTCMAKATTCQAAGACGLVEQIPAGDPRCGDAGPSEPERCADDGGTVLRCGPRFALHCNHPYYGPGSTCLSGDQNKTFWCATSKTCSVTQSCLGSLLEYCDIDGLRNNFNCAAIGTSCGVDPDGGNNDCLLEGQLQLCPSISSSCKGDAVEVCDGEKKSLFYCKDINGTCVNPQGTARCARPEDRCTPFDLDVNVCNGSKLHLCVGGKLVDFDCAGIGLSCKAAAGSVPAQCAQ